MLGRTNTGSGGGGLNFKVIGNPQPETAKENTIWVDTDKINNYYFSAEQPENMAEYDVWFPIGTSSNVAFSATKKNTIMVYPLTAKQMVSGALVEKTAKSWQGGEWADWIIRTYLFKSGTGALVNFKTKIGSNAAINITENGIESSYTGSTSISTNLRVSYDVTNKTYLCVEYVCGFEQEKGITVALLQSETDDTNFPNSYIAKAMMERTTEKITMRIPIPGTIGTKWVVVIGASTYTIYNIWFEE